MIWHQITIKSSYAIKPNNLTQNKSLNMTYLYCGSWYYTYIFFLVNLNKIYVNFNGRDILYKHLIFINDKSSWYSLCILF